MSTVPTLHELDEAQARESTLFDSLARLVPEELQTSDVPPEISTI
jgi:hypothetical protein